MGVTLMEPGERMAWLARCRRAADYSARHEGVALVVQVKGERIFEDHPGEGGPARVHPLASGTKSFSGMIAAAAVDDGMVRWDEALSDVLREWRHEHWKSKITVRQLLQLVSGLESGAKPGASLEYGMALETRVVAEPGTKFLYGTAPFQVFGEFMRRKLAMLGEDPLGYLESRVLDPIGLKVGRWRRGRDGWPDLSGGAGLAAAEWAKLGEVVRQDGGWQGRQVISGDSLQECFVGSEDNPVYGLGWWLNAPLPESGRAHLRQATMGLDDLWGEGCVPRDLVYAAGAGKQRMYVSREGGWVVVRQARGILKALGEGERGGFSDREFLRLLLKDAG